MFVLPWMIIAPSGKSNDLTVIRGKIIDLDPGLLAILLSTQIILVRAFYLSMTIERMPIHFPRPFDRVHLVLEGQMNKVPRLYFSESRPQYPGR
jgi:hypothetical protein